MKKIILIVISIALYLTSGSIKGAGDSHTQDGHVLWALTQAWLLPGTIFEKMRESCCTIASSFERLWILLTGKQLSINHHTIPVVIPSSNQVKDELSTMHRAHSQLHSLATTGLLDDHLSELERTTLTIIKATTEKAFLVDSAFGFSGAAILLWLYQGHEALMFHELPTRFIGVGIGTLAALKAATSFFAPLLAPIGLLIVGSYGWWRIKQSIIEPYRLQHQSEIEKIKAALLEHKKTIALNEQELARTMEDALQKIVKEIHEKIQKVHQETRSLQQETAAQIATLSATEAKETKNLEAQQEELRRLVATKIETINETLRLIQDDVKTTQATNGEIKRIVSKALPTLETAMSMMADLKAQSQAALDELNRPKKTPPQFIDRSHPKTSWFSSSRV